MDLPETSIVPDQVAASEHCILLSILASSPGIAIKAALKFASGMVTVTDPGHCAMEEVVITTIIPIIRSAILFILYFCLNCY